MNKYLNYAKEALETNLILYRSKGQPRYENSISFQTSAAGLYTLGALICQETKEYEKLTKYTEKLLEY